MSKNYGIMVNIADDGAIISNRIKEYDNYEEMVTDLNPGKFGIVRETNTVYHYQDGSWVIGFPSVDINSDCTAFEILIHKNDIPAGDTEIVGSVDHPTTQIIRAISSIDGRHQGLMHGFTIRTMCPDTKMSDVIIDWGDGTTSSIRNEDFIQEGEDYYVSGYDAEAGERDYGFLHTYTLPEGVKYKKYIVRIFGTRYYNIVHGLGTQNGQNTLNRMCRVFDIDLPIAQHFVNLSRFCSGATALREVSFENMKYRYFVNLQGLLSNCYNLRKAVGFKRNLTRAYCGGIFDRCFCLEETDMQLSADSVYKAGNSQLFRDCYVLAIDVASIVPERNNWSGTMSIKQLFYNNRRLTGIVPASILWNNKNVVWTDTDQVFTGCSDAIRSQVPVSWGGTASDDIIEKTNEERLADIESRLAALEAASATI